MKKFGVGFLPFRHAAKTLWAKANDGVRELTSTTDQSIVSKARLDASLILPCQALFALAAELGLKAAVESLTEEKPHGHDLVTLFEMLPDDRACSFKEHFDTDFDQKLKKHRKNFQESRYFFEPTKDGSNLEFDTSFMEKFVDTLWHEFAVELQNSANG